MAPTPNRPPPTGTRVCYGVELPQIDYRAAWQLQAGLVAARRQGSLERDIFIFLEHPPVFTLGRRGGRENLVVPETLLEKSGIPVVQVERGGNITYHGPGQLVVYPIIDLQAAGLGVTDYVSALETVMIRLAADFGVSAQRDARNRGAWVGNNKLGSIGIAVRRGVSFHGLAFNANLALAPFGWINPCGLKDVGMTTLACERGTPVSMTAVRQAAWRQIVAVFGVLLERKPPEWLNAFAVRV
ncbi:MAG: lipoyl(octanoyl) transferase LipB [Desulfobacterales bacterium]